MGSGRSPELAGDAHAGPGRTNPGVGNRLAVDFSDATYDFAVRLNPGVDPGHGVPRTTLPLRPRSGPTAAAGLRSFECLRLRLCADAGIVLGMTAQTIIQYFIPVALATMMFSMGVGLRWSDFRRVAAGPAGVVAGMFGQLLLLPLLALAVAAVSGLSMELQVGLVLVASCPGGPSSNLYTYHARGDLALSVVLTALSGIVTVFTIPLWVNLAGQLFAGDLPAVQMAVIPTMLKVGAVTVVPVLAGMVMRSRLHDESAARWEKRMSGVATGILVVLVAGAVSSEARNLVRYAGEVGIAVLVLAVLGMLLGWGLGLLARQGPRVAVTLAIEVGMQNSGLAISLALSSFAVAGDTSGVGDVAFAVPAAVYAILLYGLCAVAIWVGRRTVVGGDEAAG